MLNTWLGARPADDYQLELVSDSKPTGLTGEDIILIVAAAIVATLGLGAITLWFFLGRRTAPTALTHQTEAAAIEPPLGIALPKAER